MSRVEIEILRPDATIVVNGHRHHIKGRADELFRLFVLGSNNAISKDSIAALRSTEPEAARRKVSDLKEQLKGIGVEHLITSSHGLGYRANLNGHAVDAHTFRKVLEPLRGGLSIDKSRYPTSDSAIADIAMLQNTLRLWHGNPAEKLPVETSHRAHFDTLKQRGDDLLLMARLHSGEHSEIREALLLLEHRCWNPDQADDICFELLLLGFHAIGSTGKINKTWEKLSKQGGERTRKLSALVASLNRSDFVNPFGTLTQEIRAESGTSGIESLNSNTNENSLESMCKVLGITTASNLRLADSRLTPKHCINRARHRLFFSGVLASKWVTEPSIRSEFGKMLSRFDKEGGEAKFLMINPRSDSFQRLHELRQGMISDESVDRLKQLEAAHKSLQVRVFNNLPAFRIVVIDNDVVGFSTYRLAAPDYILTEQGWEAPHVVLDPYAEYPLAEAFELLFTETWKSSTPLKEVV